MKCSDFERTYCTSCNLLNLSYQETIVLKEKKLDSLFYEDLLKRRASVSLVQTARESRTKAKFAVFSRNDEIEFGFYSADGVAKRLEDCPLHANGINQILNSIKGILKKYKITSYDIATKKGELKYLLISKSDSNDELLLRFILRSKEALDRLRIAVIDLEALPFHVSVVTANIQPVHQAILEGDEEIILTSKKMINHQFDEFNLLLGPRSFFQVTPEIARKLYSTLALELEKNKINSVLDLYCGVGAFSFYSSRFTSKVVGVEISQEAIACAEESKRLNKISNAHFFSMDAEQYLKQSSEKFEAVIVNPPRRGLNTTIVNLLKSMQPKMIYYSSCNAETLLRDYLELKNDYSIEMFQLFDMFPYTDHFETLMCLKKK